MPKRRLLMTGIILAGGVSRRLGLDKTFLNIGGESIINRLVTRLTRVCGEVIIVSNKPERFLSLGVKVTADLLPKRAALVGIYSGILKSASFYNFVCACDMPFVNPRVVRYLAAQAPGFDVVIPVTKAGLEPLHAVYSRNCLGAIKEEMAKGKFRIIDFFNKVKVKYIKSKKLHHLDPLEETFFNINTRKDLVRAEQSGFDSGKRP